MGFEKETRSLCRAALVALFLTSLVLDPFAAGAKTPFDPDKALERLLSLEHKDPAAVKELLQNGRPTFIAFIDHLCFYCLESVEVVEDLQRRFAQTVNVVVINPERAALPVQWLKRKYNVWSVPMFVLIDKEGQVRKKHFGPPKVELMASELAQLVKE